MQIQIVGGGQAGIQIAASLRSGGFEGAINLFCGERVLPYQRPPLSKDFILGKKSEETIFFKNQNFFDTQRIKLSFRWVKEIDREEQCVKDCQDEKYSYDILILAIGSKSRVFELPENVESKKLPEILTLRSLVDAKRIRATLLEDIQRERTKYLVIGGGFIGLELASAFSSLDFSVTVLEKSSRLMGRAVPDFLGHWFFQLHKANGVKVIQNATEKEEPRQHLFDRIIVGIGAEVDLTLARQANLSWDRRGLQVNEFMQTSDQKIYAIGDCTSHKNIFWHARPQGKEEVAGSRIRLESVQNAIDQAKVAAAHILGHSVSYNMCPWFWSVQHGVSLQMAGLYEGYDQVCWRGEVLDSRGRGIDSFREKTRSKERKLKSSCFYFRRGRFIACHSVNAPGDHLAARSLLQRGIHPEIHSLRDTKINLRSLIS